MDYERKHDQDTPKSWFRLFIQFGGWIAFICGVLLIILTFVAESRLYLADQLDRDGRHARAVVIETRKQVTQDADGDTSEKYYVTLRFKTRDGGTQTEVSVNKSYYETVAQNDQVVIRYLRSDPSKIEVEENQYRYAGVFFRTLGLVIGLGGLGALWFFGGKASRAIRARRFGQRRMAKVIGILETNVEVNKKRQARLQWREDDGQTGQSQMHDLSYLSQRYKSGDPIVVFRLGKTAVWEGDVGPPQRDLTD